MQEIFLQDFFQGATDQIRGRAITGLLVKQARIALPNPTRTAEEIWTASCDITGNLIVALCRTTESRSGEHALLMGEGREEI